jgi:hypothetical protein
VRIRTAVVIFTEHLDFEGWRIGPQDTTDAIKPLIRPEASSRCRRWTPPDTSTASTVAGGGSPVFRS